MKQHRPDHITIEFAPEEIASLGKYFQTHKDEIENEALNYHKWLTKGFTSVNVLKANASYLLTQNELMDQFTNLWLYQDIDKPF